MEREIINPVRFGPFPLHHPISRKHFREHVAERLSYHTKDDHLTWEDLRSMAEQAAQQAKETALQGGDLEGLRVRINGRGPGADYSFPGRHNGVVWLRWQGGDWHLIDAFTDDVSRGEDAGTQFFPRGAESAVRIADKQPAAAPKEHDGGRYWWNQN